MLKRILPFFFLLIAAAVNAQSNFWADLPESGIQTNASQRKIIPDRYRTLQLDTVGIKNFLRTAPKEFSRDAHQRQVVLSIPMPYGGSQRFAIVETEVMEPGLQAMFPQIKAYGGQGIDDRTASIKIDIGPRGFHAAIRSPVNGSTYIDPYAQGLLTSYISYYKKDLRPTAPYVEEEDPQGSYGTEPPTNGRVDAFTGCTADTLRVYRLAVACTGEYGVAVGATTVAQALSAIVTSVNRVNGVYETELAIRLVLVDSEYKVVYIDPATDPFTQNNNGSGLLTESITVCNAQIGFANYDIGHTFSTGAGGVAGLRVVCGTTKARGVTGRTNPTGDAYDIDYVAHEMGHQFGGNHTFNSVTGSCNGNRSAAANAEPGSATTIMGYAGICRANDLQPNSDAYFHPVSYTEMTNFSVLGTGNSCPVRLLTGNSAPTVDAGLDYTIPKSTPFMLSGSAIDPDGDPLTYAWDQVDVGGPAGNWNLPVGQAPLFRFFPPTTAPTRYFPQLSDIVNNTTTIGEILPNYGRTINFRFTARDNRAGGGGNCYDASVLTVNAAAGPFVVLYPNTAADSVLTGTFMKVRWDVAKTNLAPVSCDSVMIELSLDGGYTYPIMLLSKTANDGMEDIIVPNNPTTTARIRVRALKNVFFDISNVNFKIITNTASEFLFNEPEPVLSCTGANPSMMLRTVAINGFPGTITLSASGTPAGATVVFGSNIINANSSVMVMLQGTIAPGTYPITVTGTAGSIVKTCVIRFNVGSPTIAPRADAPVSGAADNVLTPTLVWSALPIATSYRLQVSPRVAFDTTIVDTTGILINRYTIMTALAQNTNYYWRVQAINACGSSPFSTVFNFKTANVYCGGDTLRSVAVPIVIPTTRATITSTLTIPSGAVISDVDVVGLVGTHTYVSDLAFYLQSPAGTRVTLFNWVCTSNANFNINLDDEAASATITCPPTGGQTRKPLQPLSAFDNQNSTGTWTLSVSDTVTGQGGSLTGWGLRICSYSASILPLNWLSFTAVKNADNTTVAAKWQTANEVNNHHYEIERSTDGRNFTMIGTIAAGNNRNTIQNYLYNDLAPVMGTNYYRVKQVDNDSKSSYSAIAKVVFGKDAAGWSVYPNPAKDKTTLYAKQNLNAVQVRLTDVSGKVVYNGYIPTLLTGQAVNIPLTSLAKGMYFLKVYSEKQTTTEKIMVE